MLIGWAARVVARPAAPPPPKETPNAEKEFPAVIRRRVSFFLLNLVGDRRAGRNRLIERVLLARDVRVVADVVAVLDVERLTDGHAANVRQEHALLLIENDGAVHSLCRIVNTRRIAQEHGHILETARAIHF